MSSLFLRFPGLVLIAASMATPTLPTSSYHQQDETIQEVEGESSEKVEQPTQKPSSLWSYIRAAAILILGASLLKRYFSISKDTSPTKSETFAMIKPDAFEKANEIKALIIEDGFKVKESFEFKLSKEQAALFYQEHDGKKFFEDLINYITSGPVIVMRLCKEGDDAIRDFRKLMGPTDSKKAKNDEPNTIRALYGTNIEKNAIHGSSCEEDAKRELEFFFDNENP